MTRCFFLSLFLFLTLPALSQRAGTVLRDGHVAKIRAVLADRYFSATEIPDSVFERMRGRSFADGCTVPRSELRYLRLLHANDNGQTQVGEMVCNKAIAEDLLSIFRRLYLRGYRISRMVLIDDYGADDERSMAANNTTCFNFRLMTGSASRVSKHGRGLAVDINPLYNPYVKGSKVTPAAGRPYADRSLRHPMVIRRGDLCHTLFQRHGFSWGGAWRTLKDYQHFEK